MPEEPDGGRTSTIARWRERGTELGRGTLAVVQERELPLLASGAAFWAVLAVIPALGAVVGVYGLVASPDQAADHVGDLLSTVSPEGQSFFTARLEEVAGATSGSLGFGLALSLLSVLWTTSSGVLRMAKATAIAIQGEDDRTTVRMRLLSLAGALAVIVVVGLVVAVVAVAPAVLDDVVTGSFWRTVLQVAQWLLLLALVAVACAALYRWAPSKRELPWRVVLASGAAASAGWLLATILLGLYVTRVAGSGGVWGALGGVAVVMVWFLLSALVVLTGGALATQLDPTTDRPDN